MEEIYPGFPKNAWPLTLTVGNGAIGYNADATGMQSMNTTYNEFPLVTLSDWGWHATPWGNATSNPFVNYPFNYYNISTGREVGYPMRTGWFNANPHRINLIQVGLRRRSNTSAPLLPSDLHNGTGSSQQLDPWTGEAVSNFSFGAQAVPITTKLACHMDLDLVSWRIDTSLLAETENADSLVLRIAFPYADDGTPTKSPWTVSHAGANGQGSNWDSIADSRHTSTLSMGIDGQSARIARTLDHDAYEVVCRWSDKHYSLVRDDVPHAFVLQHDGSSGSGISFELSCLLAPPAAQYPVGATGAWLTGKSQLTRPLLRNKGATLPLYTATAANAAQRWEQFWLAGAAIDLASGLDPVTDSEEYLRAFELERRAVLSQYLTRSQSAGSQPPQETGYTMNSWMGRFHHEMRFFHQTHFGLWGRPELLARSDSWFIDALANATSYAKFQGYAGARWPKEVGVASAAVSNPGHGMCDAPSVGAMSPNSTFPLLYWNTPSFQNLLIWQQPHPIWMTEVERLNSPNPTAAQEVEKRMGAVVEATADFMASFAVPPPVGSSCLPGCSDELWLGPPLERQSASQAPMCNPPLNPPLIVRFRCRSP